MKRECWLELPSVNRWGGTGREGSAQQKRGHGHVRVFTPSRTPMASSFVAKMSFSCFAPPVVILIGARSALRLGFFLVMCLVAEVAAFLAALRTTRPAIVCWVMGIRIER